MKSISILGTSSNAGKSWLNTAFCALMRRKGIHVAPFKAQNMSNNSFVTLEGGEIGRAQAVQAEACGLRPIAQMNPVLLKPSGDSVSQVVCLGKPGLHVAAGSYYKDIDRLRSLVRETLDWWKPRCDLLLVEGAGSPVELNLLDRDIVNLFPIDHLDGRWILAADVERGGVFAHTIGTVQLMPASTQSRGLGFVVNKFRGDLDLFEGVEQHFGQHIDTPYLGVLPMREDLQPETEDGFTILTNDASEKPLPIVASVNYPRVSNSQDLLPWTLDEGVELRWVKSAQSLERADVIILPGSKDTIADLQWLRRNGMADVIRRRAAEGVPIVGICGGYQMLGESLVDPDAFAGSRGVCDGLGLLPIKTIFESEKRVVQVAGIWHDHEWDCYEIHMGQSCPLRPADSLLKVRENGAIRPEGMRIRNVWGTYLHGFFEATTIRSALCQAALIESYRPGVRSWKDHKQWVYDQMADTLEAHLSLEHVYRYVGL